MGTTQRSQCNMRIKFFSVVLHHDLAILIFASVDFAGVVYIVYMQGACKIFLHYSVPYNKTTAHSVSCGLAPWGRGTTSFEFWIYHTLLSPVTAHCPSWVRMIQLS